MTRRCRSLTGLPAPIAPWLDFAGVLAISALSVGGSHLLASYRRDLLRANRDLIDAFWEGEIDNFDEILARVRRVPAPGVDRWRT